VTRGVLVLGAALFVAGVSAAPPALAQTSDPTVVLVIRLEPVSPDRVLGLLVGMGLEPGRDGGLALLAHAGGLDEALDAARDDPDLDVTVHDGDDVSSATLAASGLPTDLATAGQAWIVAGGSAPGATDLGVVAMMPGSSDGEDHEIPTLTSDSTRRDGVVVTEDLLPTMRSLAGLPEATSGGAVIRPVDAPVPLELLARYVATRRMSVPIQTAAGLFVTFVGLVGVGLLAWRDRVPTWLSSVGAWAAISVVPLALSLLLVGHLGTLTYVSVVTTTIAGTVVGCVAAALVARRWGTTAALGALGVVTIALFLLEAGLGWTAALATFLGGTQLDGGRFYGLPNVDIGLLVGAGVFVAYRTMPGAASGVALLAGLAMFAGLPFAGANLGAAVTLGAVAGLWWGLRQGRPGWAIAVATLVGGGLGGTLTLLSNAALPGAPTHITNFVEGQGGGVIGTVLHRLGAGVDLIARNPFAIVPVIGVPATMLAVLRPPAPVRASFDRHPGWREALLAILWGGVVAYLANDTGAAALSLAFGTALGGLLFVSLRDRPWMMDGT
jgi:hypothetical protein